MTDRAAQIARPNILSVLRRGDAFGGRQPLCAIGVTSRIDVMFNQQPPARASATHDPNRALNFDFDRLHAMFLCFLAPHLPQPSEPHKVWIYASP